MSNENLAKYSVKIEGKDKNYGQNKSGYTLSAAIAAAIDGMLDGSVITILESSAEENSADNSEAG